MSNEEILWYEQHAQDEREYMERNWYHVERLH